MKSNPLSNFFLPPGPILSLTLIGIMILSALLYYKAIQAQRFLEPSLALSQPRIAFKQNMIRLIEKEFGQRKIEGILVASDSLFVNMSLLFKNSPQGQESGIFVLNKLGKVFLYLLENPRTRAQFDLVLIIARVPYDPQLELDAQQGADPQSGVELILDSLYKAEPALKREYRNYFATTTQLVPEGISDINWVEFRIITSNRLHIDMIRQLWEHVD